jgi:4-amino-4-deoxy-L-arabinose transferase-like glycosyltransferase
MYGNHSKERFFIIVVFLLAISLRLFNIIEFKANDPTFDSALPGSDMHTFEEWAGSILDSGWLDRENTPPLQAPLYPYFVAALMKLFGRDLLWVKLAQALLGSVSCVLVYVLGKRVFDGRVGAVAALMAAFYGMFLFYEAHLLMTALVMFLCIASILSLQIAKEKKTASYHLAAGVILGLTTLASPNIMLFVPLAILWLWWSSGAEKSAMKLICTAILLGGFVAAVAPVAAKNYLVGGERVLISKNGGICFYIGNCIDSSGTLTITPSMLRIAPDFYKLTPRQRADIDWFGAAVRQIKGDPAGYLGLLARKTIMFLAGYEVPNNVNYYLSRRFSTVLRVPLLLSFWMIAPLALVGILASLKEWPRRALPLLFIVCYSASIVALFVLSRFRVPLVPFLLIFAGYCVVWWYEKLRSSDWKKACLSLIPLLLVGMFTFATRSGYIRENDYANLGLAYQAKGRCDLAAPEFANALRVDRDYYPARKGLEDCAHVLGEKDQLQPGALGTPQP